jgi:hypothetical protein
MASVLQLNIQHGLMSAHHFLLKNLLKLLSTRGRSCETIFILLQNTHAEFAIASTHAKLSTRARERRRLRERNLAARKKAIVALARQLAIDLWRIRTGRVKADQLGLTIN